MPSFTETALRLLQTLVGRRSTAAVTGAGTVAVLDGQSAVALIESRISQSAGLGPGTPDEGASLVWRRELQRRKEAKQNGKPYGTILAEGARGGLAAAAGASLSGMRSTTFLNAQEAAALQDLLATIAGRHLPLVAHIENRALGGSSSASGSGHEACHLSVDSGCLHLCAVNVQEAVDFTLVARRVAEQALQPGLVFIDREQTACSMQQVNLPSGEFISAYLGSADDLIPCRTPAEKVLFGEQRRRVPRWHDPDRPVLLGAAQPSTVWGLSRAASRLYLETSLENSLDEAFKQFAAHSGRYYSPVTSHRVDDADLLLVLLGAAIETAEVVADALRAERKLKVGVFGIRSLHPFPAQQIAERLQRAKTVCVLERLVPAGPPDPPLLRALKAAVRLREQSAGGATAPKLLSVLYGSGGLPLHASDLFELCLQAANLRERQVTLGIAFDQSVSPHPKRQVLLDRLRRDYPDLSSKGISGERSLAGQLLPKEGITLALHRVSGTGGEGWAQEAADLLWRVAGGELRSRTTQPTQPWGEICSDRIAWTPSGIRDPGDLFPVDIALISSASVARISTELKLNQGGTLLLEGVAANHPQIPGEILQRIQSCDAEVYLIDGESIVRDTDLRTERLLGALFRILLERDLLDAGLRRLISSRETVLSHLQEALRKQHLEAFRAGFDGVVKLPREALEALPAGHFAGADEVSEKLRRLGNIDDHYDSLPRFWDQTGVLYRDRATDQITPDPYLGIGAIPPFSSAFRDFTSLRDFLPVLDPQACTGCGSCWSLCPDGAIGVSAITPAKMLETGIRMTAMDGLRPLLSKLSKRITSSCTHRGASPESAGDVLNDAFDWLLQQSLPENRKQLVTEAQQKFIAALGRLPLALTEPLFLEVEKKSTGDGSLLFLAINPDSCKGCGICITHCEPGALIPTPQSPELIADAKQHWRTWEQLPETDQATIGRSLTQEMPNRAAATLMAQSIQSNLIGGDGAEPGSGERLALRLLLAAAESRLRPLRSRFLEEVHLTREKLSTLIQKILADALPSDDLEALAEGLNNPGSGGSELATLINEAQGGSDGRIDTLRLRRLVDLAQKLKDLSWRLAAGRQGSGRAALGLVLSSNATSGWAGVFPDNPFAVPVSLDTTGDAALFAAGLQQGQLQQALDGFVLMRKARLELESPADAARLWSSIDNLCWDDLEAEERALCPPLLIAGSSQLLAGRGLSQLSEIISGKLPIKVVLFADLDLGLAGTADSGLHLATSADPGLDLALLALSRRNSFNAQCSIGYPDHLIETFEAALNFSGPALLQLYAPSPGRHGFATDQTVRQARLAVESRTFPLYRYDPEAEGVFGSRFSLEGNPGPEHDWMENHADTPLTTASWMLAERRFAHWFAPLPKAASESLPVAEYLLLEESMRSGKSAWVSAADAAGASSRYLLDPILVKACEDRLQVWRMLQEIAGVVTPFTRRIEEQAQQQVAAAHQAELQQLQASYEARIKALKQELLGQSRSEIRSRLMALAGYDTSLGKSAQAHSEEHATPGSLQ